MKNNLLKIALEASTVREAVRVIIRKGNKVCVCAKMFKGKTELIYVFPGGGVEPGDSLEETCIKESLEEVGILIHNVKSLDMTTVAESNLSNTRVERIGKFDGLMNHYFEAEYLRIDNRVFGDCGDAMKFEWLTIPEAIVRMKEGEYSSFADERIAALKLLK